MRLMLLYLKYLCFSSIRKGNIADMSFDYQGGFMNCNLHELTINTLDVSKLCVLFLIKQ